MFAARRLHFSSNTSTGSESDLGLRREVTKRRVKPTRLRGSWLLTAREVQDQRRILSALRMTRQWSRAGASGCYCG